MAKGYRVLRDTAFPKVVSKISDDNYAVEGVNYPAGSIVRHDQMTPRDQERAESGDLDHLLSPVEDEEYDQALMYDQDAEPEFGVFVAEHEAEAHALREAGHHVIPKQQVLESLSAGAEHAAQYQQAAAEASERPNQAYMAQAESDEARVPDHLLHGAETRTGTPHNRGLSREDFENGPEESEEEGPNASPRARPNMGREVPSDDEVVDSQQETSEETE